MTRPAHKRVASSSRRDAWCAVALGGCVVYFVTAASLWLDRPGLYMDETIFVHSALGGGFPHQEFVDERVAGVPVMVSHYIGTVKSAVFAPLFAIMGVSVATVRLPAIALSAATLVVAYILGREVVGRWSVALVAFMATSPSFIIMSKVDWSPMVIAVLLSMGVLLSFFRYMRTERIGWLWALFGMVVVGIFDKQDFVWLPVSMGVAAVAVYRRPLWRNFRKRVVPPLIALAVFLGTLSVLGTLVVARNLSVRGSSSLQDPVRHVAATWGLYQRTVGYSEVIGFFTGRAVDQPAWMDLLWVFALVVLAIVGVARLQGPLPENAASAARAAVFFLIVACVMLVQIAATKRAVGPQHVIELLPYPMLVLLCGAVSASRMAARFRVPVSIVTGGAVVLLVAALVVATSQYVSLMRDPGRLRPVFSPDVSRDAAFLNANAAGADEVVSGGWGPGTPLFALACPADRHEYRDDVWFRLVHLSPKRAPGVVRSLFGNRRVLFVSVSDPTHSELPTQLRSDPALIARAYVEAFPDRRPQRVLTTRAYDITYFGPGRFHSGHTNC